MSFPSAADTPRLSAQIQADPTPPAQLPQGFDAISFRGAPVGWSADLQRIIALPRRTLNPQDPIAAELWTKHLARKRTEPCTCDAQWGVRDREGKLIPGSGCILALKPIQGWALEEASDAHGAFINAGVGHGKTGIAILLPMAAFNMNLGRGYDEPRRCVMLIPSKAKRAFFAKHYPQMSAHFETPNLAGWGSTKDRGFIADGRPVLTVITYPELQQMKNTDILTRLRPHFIIPDEAHSVANLNSSRGKRYNRAFRMSDDEESAASGVMCAPMSGTMGDNSIKQFGHHLRYSLREKSPIPNSHAVLDQWASAIDAGTKRAPMGALSALCKPGENVQEAFSRRLNDTHGVITTDTSSVKCSLFITARKVATLPTDVAEQITKVRKSNARPDGEESTEALTTASWCRQLAAGFYYKWIYPRKEDPALIEKWFKTRKDYHREVRNELHGALEFVDSPTLLSNAARRWHEGYVHEGVTYKPRDTRGPMPVWESQHWQAWQLIKDAVQPQPKAVWVSDFLVNEAAAWSKENLGIIWTEHKAFGNALSKLTGLPFYQGGKMDPELDEKGDRSIICSVSANSDTKNLQAWSANLICNPMASGKLWEQTMGRSHRQGQRADQVDVEVFLHTAEMRRAFDTACSRAYFAHTVLRTPQKLIYGTMDLTHAVVDDLRDVSRPVNDDWWSELD